MVNFTILTITMGFSSSSVIRWKRFLLISGAILLSCYAHGQKRFVISGEVHSISESFKYRVYLTLTGVSLKGQSVTREAALEELSAAVSGKIDTLNHTITFAESPDPSVRVMSKYYYCYFTIRGHYHVQHGEMIIDGTYTSQDVWGNDCDGGFVHLQGRFIPPAAHGKPKKPSHEKKRLPVIAPQQTAIPEIKPHLLPAPDTVVSTGRITAGKGGAYEWHSDIAVLEVWDGGDIDGDIITVTLNGKEVLNNYMLAREKKELTLHLQHGLNTISILAVNEGSEPPNTAKVLLKDENRLHDITAYNMAGNAALISIKAP